MSENGESLLTPNKSKIVLGFLYGLMKSIFLSLFLGLVIFPFLVNLSYVSNFLKSSNKDLLIGISGLLILFLLVSWKGSKNFWRRYKNTSKIMPYEFTDIDIQFLVFVLSMAVIFKSYESFSEWSWEIKLFLAINSAFCLIYLLISFYWPEKDEKEKTLLQTRDSSSDEPISYPDEDLLNRRTFVNGVHAEIKNLELKGSFVFGLYGDWGDGKTSVLNLLRLRLNDDRVFLVVNFEPWNFQNEEAMLRAFFDKLEKVLESDYLIPEKNLFSRYQHLVSFGLENSPLKFIITPNQKTIEDVRGLIEQYIEVIGKKLLIIIDEIDRLQPNEIRMIFKLVRSNSKFKNSIFLLSMDKNQILEKLGDGEGSLEKTVQKPIMLPKIEEHHIEEFLLMSGHSIPQYNLEKVLGLQSRSQTSTSGYIVKLGKNRATISGTVQKSSEHRIVLLSKKGFPQNLKVGDRVFIEGVFDKKRFVFDGLSARICYFRLSQLDLIFEKLLEENKTTREQIAFFDKEFVVFYRTHLSKLIGNLRDAKRFLNSLRSSLPAIAEEVNVFDFVVLEFVKVFGSKLYEDIYRNWWFYVDQRYDADYFSNPLSWSLSNEQDAKKKSIQEHIKEFFKLHTDYEKQKESLIAILTKLFPNISGRHHITAEDRKVMRIFTSCFSRYFTQSVTSKELSDAFFRFELKKWQIKPNVRTIKDTLANLKKKDKLGGFLDKLRRVYVDDLSLKVINALLKTISNNTKSFSRKRGGDLWDSEYERALMLVLRILNSKIDNKKIQTTLENILSVTPDLAFAVDLVLMTKKDRGGDLFTIYDNSDNGALRKVVAKRLYNYYIRGKRNITREHKETEVWARILYQWGSNWSDFHSPSLEIVTSYTISIFNKDPKRFFDFIKSFSSGFPSSEWGMNVDEYKNVYNLGKVANLAKKFLKTKELNNEQKVMLKTFIALHRKNADG